MDEFYVSTTFLKIYDATCNLFFNFYKKKDFFAFTFFFKLLRDGTNLENHGLRQVIEKDV